MSIYYYRVLVNCYLGDALLCIGDQAYKVKGKDLVIVEPKVKHHIETQGLEYVAITRPDWDAG